MVSLFKSYKKTRGKGSATKERAVKYAVSGLLLILGIWIAVKKGVFDFLKSKKTDTEKAAKYTTADIAERARQIAMDLGTHKDYSIWDPRSWTENDQAVYLNLSTMNVAQFQAASIVYKNIYTKGRDLKTDLTKLLDTKYYNKIKHLFVAVPQVSDVTNNMQWPIINNVDAKEGSGDASVKKDVLPDLLNLGTGILDIILKGQSSQSISAQNVSSGNNKLDAVLGLTGALGALFGTNKKNNSTMPMVEPVKPLGAVAL